MTPPSEPTNEKISRTAVRTVWALIGAAMPPPG